MNNNLTATTTTSTSMVNGEQTADTHSMNDIHNRNTRQLPPGIIILRNGNNTSNFLLFIFNILFMKLYLNFIFNL